MKEEKAKPSGGKSDDSKQEIGKVSGNKAGQPSATPNTTKPESSKARPEGVNPNPSRRLGTDVGSPKRAQDPEEILFDSEEEELEIDEEEGKNVEVALETALVPDTSERIILVVDEEGQRRGETVAIINQILPNAIVEVANDPEEAIGMMEEGDFDTFVVNFLMPGYSSSHFVKSVANHPDHPLLIGFAADKMSDAVDPKKGLKIIPLKRLFDLDSDNTAENPDGEKEED